MTRLLFIVTLFRLVTAQGNKCNSTIPNQKCRQAGTDKLCDIHLLMDANRTLYRNEYAKVIKPCRTTTPSVSACIRYTENFKNHILIKPEDPEITLPSDTNSSIICYGEVPVTWKFKDYGITKVESNIVINDQNETFEKYEYKSTLSLTRVSYLNVGYYYCGPKLVNFEKRISDLKKIYIYVQDDNHLLMDANKTLNQNEYAEVIIPCLPTTPDVKIVLKMNDMKMNENVHFDPKIGFTFWFFFSFDVNNITCEANYNGILEIQHFLIHRNLNAIHLKINDGNLDSVIVGQNLTLKCSIYTYSSTSYYLRWKSPEKINLLNPDHINMNHYCDFVTDEYNVCNDLITFRNVTEMYNGIYHISVVNINTGLIHKEMFTLKVIHILIIPEDPEITLPSDTNSSIICYGEVPVTWKFKDYGIKKVESTIVINDKNETFEKYEYKSTLSLTRVSYLNVGYYYCGPKLVNIEKRISDLKKIYIYVRDDNHLLMDANKTLNQNEYAEVIIPCLPTTPDVKIVLKMNDMKMNENVNFDPKIGFTFWFFFSFDVNNITCEANHNGILEIQHFLIHRNLNAIHLKINDGNLDSVIVGQNLTLNCSIYTYTRTYYSLVWISPNTFKLNTIDYIDSKFCYLVTDEYKVCNHLKTIRNVTEKCNGKFNISVMNTNTGLAHKEMFTIKVIHILIIPEDPEITLPSDTNSSIICYGEVPVTWKFKDYGITKVESNIVINDQNETFEKYEYKSTLSLTRVSYLNVGYYYCGPKLVNFEKRISDLKKIYIYVQDDNHLLMDANKTLNQNEYAEVIIPCLPTTPDVKIVLKMNDMKVIQNVHFNKKIGLIFWFFFNDDVNDVTCEANNNSTIESQHFLIYRNLNAIHLKINSGNSDPVIVGQNLTINYSIFKYPKTEFIWIQIWKFPEEFDWENSEHVYDPKGFESVLHFDGYVSINGFIIIRNVSKKDNGVYSCIVTNKNTGFTYSENYTLNVIHNAIIWPNVSYLVLKENLSKKKHALICKGNEPIQWLFMQYDGHFVVKKNTSTITFPTSQNKLTYFSLLLFNKASYLDVGYYYCLPMSVDLESLDGFKRIYIYIEQESHLLAAYESTSVDIRTDIYNKQHIPCLPTTPDVNIRIMNYAEDVTYRFKFHNETGFKSFYTLNSRNFFDLKCFANSSRNNITDNRKISNFMESTFNINNGLLYDVILGQNVSINCCSSLDSFHIYYTLRWIYPETVEKKTNYTRLTYQNNRRIILLNFPNVTTEDEGEYKCMATSIDDPNLRTYKTYKLKVYKPNEAFLNLRIISGKKKEIRPAEYTSMQWIVQVSSNINASLLWTGPNGQQLSKSEKTDVIYEKNSSLLLIRDIHSSDSGIYTLTAHNEAISNEIKVALFVEEKPSVSLTNNLHSSVQFYEIGQNHQFEFHVNGYPLPNVECAFAKCHNYPLGECLHSEMKEIKKKTMQVSESTLVLVISMNITYIGTLICKATNSLGTYFKRHTVLVSDTSKDLEIRGPPVIFEGDDVTIKCIASKYKYLNDFKWIYPYDDKTKHLIYTTENETEFSYYSYLTVNKISNKFIGDFNCSAKLITKLHEGLPETEIKSFTVKLENASNDLEIRGPPVIFEGDDVTIECIASKYKYLNDFKWIYSYDDETKHLVYTVKNESEFSYYSYLTINKISNKFIGDINCSAKLITRSHEGFPETEIKSFTVKLEEQRINGDDDLKVFVLCILLTIFIEFLVMGSIIFLKFDQMWQNKLDLIRKNNSETWKRSIGIKEEDYLLPYSKRLEFLRKNLILGKQLGSGAYGVVFEGTAFGILDKNTVTPVAVKTVHQNSKTCSVIALASELKIMMRLGKHLNVVRLLGVCNSLSMDQSPMVILEYCRYGNIHQYMLKHRSGFVNQITPDGCVDCVIGSSSENPICQNNSNENCAQTLVRSDSYNHGDDENTNNKPLCAYDLLCWSYQIARGLDYLDSLKILHGDLAARNILLADDNIVKLCDFGLARFLNYNEIYEKEPKQDLLPIKWLAIESIRDLVFSRKSDVWSFGIVVWEIFSLASIPYPSVQIYDLLDILSEGYRMEQPTYANSNIYEIMLDCWKAEPFERPSFDDLCKRLGDLLQQCTKSDYVIVEENDGNMKNERLLSTSSTDVLPKHSDINIPIAPENLTTSHLNNDQNLIDKNDIEMRLFVHDEL